MVPTEGHSFCACHFNIPSVVTHHTVAVTTRHTQKRLLPRVLQRYESGSVRPQVHRRRMKKKKKLVEAERSTEYRFFDGIVSSPESYFVQWKNRIKTNRAQPIWTAISSQHIYTQPDHHHLHHQRRLNMHKRMQCMFGTQKPETKIKANGHTHSLTEREGERWTTTPTLTLTRESTSSRHIWPTTPTICVFVLRKMKKKICNFEMGYLSSVNDCELCSVCVCCWENKWIVSKEKY